MITFSINVKFVLGFGFVLQCFDVGYVWFLLHSTVPEFGSRNLSEFKMNGSDSLEHVNST